MLHLFHGWSLSRARVLIERSMREHQRAEFCAYACAYVAKDNQHHISNFHIEDEVCKNDVPLAQIELRMARAD